MPEPISLSPAVLVVDGINPRLPQPNLGQPDLLRAIAADQESKLVKLAGDIARYGLSDYLKMAMRHCRRNHRSMHASCSSPR